MAFGDGKELEQQGVEGAQLRARILTLPSSKTSSSNTFTVSREGSGCDDSNDIVVGPHLEPRDETRPGAHAATGMSAADQGDLVAASQQTTSPATAQLVDPDEESQTLEQ